MPGSAVLHNQACVIGPRRSVPVPFAGHELCQVALHFLDEGVDLGSARNVLMRLNAVAVLTPPAAFQQRERFRRAARIYPFRWGGSEAGARPQIVQVVALAASEKVASTESHGSEFYSEGLARDVTSS